MKRLFIIILCCVFAVCAQAQHKSQKPVWISNTPSAGNSSYYFPSSTPIGSGNSRTDARRDAVREMIKEYAKANGFTITGEELSSMVYQSDSERSSEEVKFSDSYKISVNKAKMAYKVVDEYYETNSYGSERYTCYLLVQIAKNPDSVDYGEVKVTNKYGGKAFARSIIPGWGQMYKGSMAKGGIIIGAEVLGIGGIVASYSLKSSYEKLMYEDPKHAADYSIMADTWTNVAYGCIAFTAAVYVYNLIDAAVAPGAPRVIVKAKQKGYSMAPVIYPQGGMGMTFAYKF